jgi:protein-tyrosine phosphatase
MLMDAVEGRRGEPVADPYYGDLPSFEAAWTTISFGVNAWAERLIRESTNIKA